MGLISVLASFQGGSLGTCCGQGGTGRHFPSARFQDGPLEGNRDATVVTLQGLSLRTLLSWAPFWRQRGRSWPVSRDAGKRLAHRLAFHLPLTSRVRAPVEQVMLPPSPGLQSHGAGGRAGSPSQISALEGPASSQRPRPLLASKGSCRNSIGAGEAKTPGLPASAAWVLSRAGRSWGPVLGNSHIMSCSNVLFMFSPCAWIPFIISKASPLRTGGRNPRGPLTL